MRVGSVLDTGKILPMIPEEDSPMLLQTAERLTSSNSVCLLDDSNQGCLGFDFLGTSKWSVHIISLPRFRGKELWRFSVQAMLWMIKHRKLGFAFFFVAADNKVMKRFLAYYGLKPTSTFGNELLYIVSSEEILNFAAEQQITLED